MSVDTEQQEVQKLLRECEKLKLWLEVSQEAPADTTNELKKRIVVLKNELAEIRKEQRTNV